MAGKLSQPGCHLHSRSGAKSGRSVKQLEIPAGCGYAWRNGSPKSFGPVMRGSINKASKKTNKKGKKILGRKSSFLLFGSKPTVSAFKTPGEGVKALLQKLEILRQRSTSITQAFTELKDRHPGYLVNGLASLEGNVPGVEVGDSFRFRLELHLVGLHRQTEAGIDSKTVTCPDGGEVRAAVSVVISGGYEDDVDEGETLTYTGGGGNDRASKRQIEDQKLEGGNLALVNSFTLGTYVRVIRGRPDANSPSGTLFTYDGLHKVVQWGEEKGISNFKVFKFKLVREPGQKPLRWFPVGRRAY